MIELNNMPKLGFGLRESFRLYRLRSVRKRMSAASADHRPDERSGGET